MKNQTDLIISITAIVLALIVAAVCYFTMPQVTAPAQPAAIVTTPVQLPQGAVRYANSLPGGGNQAGGGGGAGPRAGADSGPRGAGGIQP